MSKIIKTHTKQKENAKMTWKKFNKPYANECVWIESQQYGNSVDKWKREEKNLNRNIFLQCRLTSLAKFNFIANFTVFRSKNFPYSTSWEWWAENNIIEIELREEEEEKFSYEQNKYRWVSVSRLQWPWGSSSSILSYAKRS
jgi:hypothetical protein